MNAIELARELGKAIQADERYLNYIKAREKNDSDQELQTLIGEFNLLRMKLNRELSQKERNEEKVAELNQSARATYADIMRNENMAEYNNAKTDFDDFMLEVNGIIRMSANGEDPATCDPTATNCTGSCSTCGGCH